MGKIKISIAFFLFFSLSTYCQSNKFEQNKPSSLPNEEVELIFNDSIKTLFKIDLPIFKVYQYKQHEDTALLVLTESNTSRFYDTIAPPNTQIKAYSFNRKNGKLALNWEIKDFCRKENQELEGEENIWFWTKYLSISDLNQDKIIDPIIVYGTFGINGYDDGRIKILIVNQNKKIWIRHQNGILDFERNTQVDMAFYSLPLEIQNHVKTIIEDLIENEFAIFPYGWQEAMKNHQSTFDEIRK
jgi:hypothetical protein